MRTRSQSRHNSPQQEASPVIVEPLRIELPFHKDQLQEDPPPEVPMANNRTMAELLQAPTEGFIELCCGRKILGQNAPIMLENNRDGVAYQGPTIPTPPKVVKQGTEVTHDQVQTPSSQSTAPVQPPVSQSETPTLISVAPVSTLMPNLKSSIPYPLRRDNERRRDQANEQIEKLYKIFKDISFEISFTDALILMPKFASTLKALIGNKEKLCEMARTPMNEHCSAVILNKLPRKLRDPGKFLIPCEFTEMDECLALAYLEVLGFSDVITSGNPTPHDDPIVSTTSPTLTPFGDSDFLLFEEADAFLGLEDDLIH
nr:reverse transcriptase domain-containing protein [Tanacetum cinerariifolium]